MAPSHFPSGTRPAPQTRRPVSPVGAGLLFVALLACFLPLRHTQNVQAAVSEPVKQGIALFHEKGCEHCHGVDARGGDLGPDLSTIGKRWKNQQIATQIHDGGGGMPAFGEVLQPDEITALVEYLHTKRKAPKVKKGAQPPQPAKPAPTPDPGG
jgi:mono/diheme cytochrome c family protein